MNNKRKSTVIRWTTTAMCIGAPLTATLLQFPVWIAASDKATMSGAFVILAAICSIPFFKQIKEYMKSPAAWVMWGVMFGAFVALRAIIDQMVIVCGIGFAANVLALPIYKAADYLKALPDKLDINDTPDIYQLESNNVANKM